MWNQISESEKHPPKKEFEMTCGVLLSFSQLVKQGMPNEYLNIWEDVE